MILVTGGTGHLGAELVAQLLDREIPVRVLTRSPERARRLLGERPEIVHGDVRDPRSLPPAQSGVDGMVSAMTGFGPGGDGPRAVDYVGNLHLIRVAEAQGVHRFVLVSVHGAAADHPMELMRMKHAAEDALRRMWLDWVILRPTPLMRLWVKIVGDPIVEHRTTSVFGRGDNSINLVAEADPGGLRHQRYEPGCRRAAKQISASQAPWCGGRHPPAVRPNGREQFFQRTNTRGNPRGTTLYRIARTAG